MEWWKSFWNEYYLPVLEARKNLTKKEVDFVENVLSVPRRSKILDLASGIGRHSIELAKRGYDVTGCDFSKVYIDYAKRKAKEKSVDVDFQRADMRKINFRNKFDAAICMYTSFGYFSDKENFDVLSRVNSSLKPNGKFVIDVVNRDLLLKNFAKKIETRAGNVRMLQRNDSFDYENSRMNASWTIYSGKKKVGMRTSLRVYSYHELKGMLEQAGFDSVRGYGGFRKEKFGPNSYRLILVCRK